jgi:protein-S-isoprenylcysteine O-methyltransferase Ste14
MFETLKRILLWADVITFVIVVAMAIALRSHTVYWFSGLTLAAVTFPLWIVARLQLGSAFSVKARAQRLVTSGLYSRIRHPIYLFGALAMFGAFLALQNWVILAFALATSVPVQLVRIRRENRLLRAAFGDAYERYRSTTWF